MIGSKNKLKKKFKKSCDWFTWPCRCPFRAANASRGSYNSFLSENICQLSFSICIRICTSNLKWRIWLLLYRICANIFLNLFYPANRSLLVCACIFPVFFRYISHFFSEKVLQIKVVKKEKRITICVSFLSSSTKFLPIRFCVAA